MTTPTEKILFVDDDANLLASLERTFRRQFRLETAEGGEAGLRKISEEGPFAVVVADRQMPGMDGVQFLSTVRQRAADTVRIMLTGNADVETAIRVVNEGNIFRFLTKPCPSELLTKALQDALMQYRLVTAEKDLFSKTLNGSIKLLTEVLSMLEPQSFGRSQALRETATMLATKLGIPNAWEIHLAIMLAPIGYITIPAPTLARFHSSAKLSPPEETLIANAPEIAARLLANIPRLEGVSQIIRYLQKDFNGSGLPAGALGGDAIPLGARLIRILLDMNRLQSAGQTQAQALDELKEREGCYDPTLLASVRRALRGFVSHHVTTRAALPLALHQLAPGMVLRSNILTRDGMLVLSAGHRISGLTLEKLRNFQLMGGIQEPIMVEGPDTLVVEPLESQTSPVEATNLTT